MHELAITQSVVDAVVDHAGKARVRRVSLEIGALSGVVADSVRFCFEDAGGHGPYGAHNMTELTGCCVLDRAG